MICVLGNVYVTWGTIFVNTSGHGDHLGGGGPSGGDAPPPNWGGGPFFLDIPVSVGLGNVHD